MLQILLDLAARGVLTDLVGAFMGTDKEDKKKAWARRALYTTIAVIIAAVLFAIALGFLVAAAYMQLTTLFAPPLAALLTAGGLILIAVGALLLSRLGQKKQPARQPPEPAQGAEAFIQPILATARNILDYARNNLDIVAIVVLLIGMWLSMDDDRDEKKPDEKAD